MTTRRDWSLCEHKREEGCRLAETPPWDLCRGEVELAHTIGRRYDDVYRGSTLVVAANAVVPLCHYHHSEYDARNLSLLEYLTLEEQAYAVGKVGLERARRRLTGQREDTPTAANCLSVKRLCSVVQASTGSEHPQK